MTLSPPISALGLFGETRQERGQLECFVLGKLDGIAVRLAELHDRSGIVEPNRDVAAREFVERIGLLRDWALAPCGSNAVPPYLETSTEVASNVKPL